MSDATAQYSVVLIGRYPGKDMAVAQALARCMGRDEGWGLRIVSAAPITFLEKLSEKQAHQVQSALDDVAEAGCRFDVEKGSNSGIPKVGWAHPPKFGGRSLAEIAPGTEFQPAVPVPVSQSSSPSGIATMPALPATGAPPSPAEGPPEIPVPVTASLVVPCPYTGQKIKLSLQVTLARAESGTAVHLSAAAAPAPSLRAASGAVILPTASQPRQTGHISLPRKSGAVQLPTGNAAPSEAERQAAQANWRRNTPVELPLPDVPILPGAGRAQLKPAIHDKQPLPLNSQPMDLQAFEASLGVSPHETVRPFLDPGPNVLDESGGESEGDVEGLGGDPESEQIICSVFIERSSSPVVHELVAELHGIPEHEAAEMCVAGSVALAENIPLFEANDIKRRCAAINVSARIIRNE
ncbi:MAG TPA: hypothetical protein VKX17_06590 [Planctomycetota bacterium]|nr:hypothetical protein [Planctomycetota bacterium]